MSNTPGGFSGRSRLAGHQLARINRLLDALRESNPFYSRRLASAGIHKDLETLAEFVERVPFTLKRELAEDQVAQPPFGTNLTYPLNRYTRCSRTSGTTRTPILWLDTAESWQWMLNCWGRVYQSTGVDHHDRVFFAFSFGPFLGFWAAFESAQRLGCMLVSGGGQRSTVRLRSLLDTGATVLCCTPTYAVRLAEVAEAEGIDLADSKVRRVIVGGEPGGSVPATRARIERLWPGAKLVDHHGMTEIGPVSYGCPARPGVLHVIESAYFAEVVHSETGEACPAGGTGELVLTNLGRTGSPILRYRTGDLVRLAAEGPCECGSWEMGLEGGILGRADDMLVVRGVNVYPSTVEGILRGFDEVAEYRVEVRTDRPLPELGIEVEPNAGSASPDLARRLEKELAESIGLRIGVALVERGSLPRFEMKASRWIKTG